MPELPFRFMAANRVLFLDHGRDRPGEPENHIRTAQGAHVSQAYPESLARPSVLFDMTDDENQKRRIGYRLYLDTGAVFVFGKKADYWEARDRAGWPFVTKKAHA